MIVLTKYNLECNGKLYRTAEAVPDTAFTRELVKRGWAELTEPLKPPKKAQPPAPAPANSEVQTQ